ncbi:MAG: N-acetylmuramoyl-L-alanine amidase, partial [Gammaproteobacteria bacterium]
MYKKLIIMSLLAFQTVSANEIEFLDVKEKKDRSVEISFLLEKVSYVRSYSLTEPSRIVIEVEDSELASTEPMDFNFPIKKIRSSQEGSISKITIDLYEYVYWTKPTQIKSENGVVLGLSIKRSKNLSKNIRDIIVSIDAGHGGRDPGAVGTNNVLEKDINLLIAKELERTLRDVKGYKPVMIRNDDSFVDLNERYLRARREAADISISIHADGFRLSSVKGASVFIWSKEYSSITAENLSKKQLKSKIGEIDEEDFDEDKAQVKYPAKYKSKLDESKKLGNSILAQLKEDPYTKLHKKNVEYADFRVLKSFDTPSVLVEAGFISNPDDAE